VDHLQSQSAATSLCLVKPETNQHDFPSEDKYNKVFTAVTVKIGVFWDVTPYGSYKNRSFGGA
jgi:hypothetical protein